MLLREARKNIVENSDHGIVVDWRVGILAPGWKDSISEVNEPREERCEVRRHLLYDQGFKNLHMGDFLAAHLFICAFKLVQVKPLSHWGALLSSEVELHSPTIVRPFEHCGTKESDIHQRLEVVFRIVGGIFNTCTQQEGNRHKRWCSLGHTTISIYVR